MWVNSLEIYYRASGWGTKYAVVAFTLIFQFVFMNTILVQGARYIICF
jgi:hypothetical protein